MARKDERRASSTTSRPTSRPVPTPGRLKRLTLDLDESLHRAIKKNAAEEGVTMAQKLRSLLLEHYRAPAKRPY